MRSIAPERWWDDFYRRLLDRLEAQAAWLAPAAEIVEFYRRRRSVDLDVICDEGSLTIRARADGEIDGRLQLRVRSPHSSQPDLLPLPREPLRLAVPA
jgi:hypothetical protein